MISDVNQQNWNFLSDFSSILFGSMEIKTNFRLRQKKQKSIHERLFLPNNSGAKRFTPVSFLNERFAYEI